MGWKPEEYYLAEPYEFFAACEGYFDKLEDQERLIRKQTYYTLLPHLKKKNGNLAQFWPTFSDGEQVIDDKFVISQEMYQQIKKIHGVE